MPSLVVGGVPIKIAAPGISRDRIDNVDRSRAFDNTYRASQSGTAKRDFHFSTPPITREWSDFYERVLSRIPAQACTGDVTGGASNQWTFPEDLDNAVWLKTRSAIAPNVVTAPDGTLTADKLGDVVFVSSDHYMERTMPAAFTNANQTWSFFAKPADYSWLLARSLNKANVFANTYINIATGTLGTSSGGTQTVRVVPYWDGWNRYTVMFDAGSGGTTPKFELQLATADGGNNYVGTTGNGVYLWGFQHDLDSNVATPYAGSGVVSTLSASCCSEITGWEPVRTSDGHRVILRFTLHEA